MWSILPSAIGTYLEVCGKLLQQEIWHCMQQRTERPWPYEILSYFTTRFASASVVFLDLIVLSQYSVTPAVLQLCSSHMTWLLQPHSDIGGQRKKVFGSDMATAGLSKCQDFFLFLLPLRVQLILVTQGPKTPSIKYGTGQYLNFATVPSSKRDGIAHPDAPHDLGQCSVAPTLYQLQEILVGVWRWD